MTWRIVKDSLLIGRYAASNVPPAAKGRTKIAAFDFVRPSVELRTAVV
jgi:bifunctional polynucleotide phosphatase/kinase